MSTNKNIFNCRGCGAKGDVIRLVRKMRKCGFVDAAKELNGERPAPRYSQPSRQTARTANNDNGGRVLRIWDEAVDLGGTLAAVYLAGRKLVVPEGVSGRALRLDVDVMDERMNHRRDVMDMELDA